MIPTYVLWEYFVGCLKYLCSGVFVSCCFLFFQLIKPQYKPIVKKKLYCYCSLIPLLNSCSCDTPCKNYFFLYSTHRWIHYSETFHYDVCLVFSSPGPNLSWVGIRLPYNSNFNLLLWNHWANRPNLAWMILVRWDQIWFKWWSTGPMCLGVGVQSFYVCF